MNRKTIMLFSLLLIFPALMSGFTGEIVQSFNIPGAYPSGLTFDVKYLWVSDRKKDEIHMVDPQSGSVIIITGVFRCGN